MFALDAANEIRAFDVNKDNWTGLLSRIGGLYDFRASLEPSGNRKLIHILDKILYDGMKVMKDGKEESKAVFTEGSKWTAPRVTFLSMMKLKDGFSTGQSEHD